MREFETPGDREGGIQVFKTFDMELAFLISVHDNQRQINRVYL